MSVAVYPRLAEILLAQNLSVAELERRIEQRFGLEVDPKTLYRLSHSDPIQRADLQIAGAAAAVLGVALGDLFVVEAIPSNDEYVPEPDVLTPDESRRLSELLARQADGGLLSDEQAEVEVLLTEFGQRLHERRLRQIAQRRGISVDEARIQVAAEFDDALAWWRDFEADPARRKRVIQAAKRRAKLKE